MKGINLEKEVTFRRSKLRGYQKKKGGGRSKSKRENGPRKAQRTRQRRVRVTEKKKGSGAKREGMGLRPARLWGRRAQLAGRRGEGGREGVKKAPRLPGRERCRTLGFPEVPPGGVGCRTVEPGTQ